MAGSRHLKNIASGLLGTFVSRNNDFDGYWALGILRSLAINNGLSRIVLDLIGASTNFDDKSPVGTIERTYRKRLLDMAERAGVDGTEIVRADIQIEFSNFDKYPNAIRDTRGEPYLCDVILLNQMGREYRASKIGVCDSHDSGKDRRSARMVE